MLPSGGQRPPLVGFGAGGAGVTAPGAGVFDDEEMGFSEKPRRGEGSGGWHPGAWQGRGGAGGAGMMGSGEGDDDGAQLTASVGWLENLAIGGKLRERTEPRIT